MLGIPEGRDRTQLREWSGAVVKTFDPILTREEQLAAFDAIDNIIAYIERGHRVEARHPADDLLTALIAAEDEGDRLSAEELVEQVMLLYIAGHETTVNLIGNGTLALLRDRDQLELLQADPSLDANFADELLRYDSPVQMSGASRSQPYEIGDTDDRAGIDPHDVPRFGQPRPASVGRTADRARPAPRRRQPAHVVRRRLPLVPRRAPRPARRPASRSARSCAASPNIALATDTPEWNGRIVLRGLTKLPLTHRLHAALAGARRGGWSSRLLRSGTIRSTRACRRRRARSCR